MPQQLQLRGHLFGGNRKRLPLRQLSGASLVEPPATRVAFSCSNFDLRGWASLLDFIQHLLQPEPREPHTLSGRAEISAAGGDNRVRVFPLEFFEDSRLRVTIVHMKQRFAGQRAGGIAREDIRSRERAADDVRLDRVLELAHVPPGQSRRQRFVIISSSSSRFGLLSSTDLRSRK